MKSFKIVFVLLAMGLIFNACRKYDLAEESDASGEGIGAFALKAPANNTALNLNAAIPNEAVTIEWTAAKPGLITSPSYNWVASLNTGSLDAPIISVPSDNGGNDAKLTLSYKSVDSLLKAKGIADGAKADLKWTVTAQNKETRIRATDSFNISITRFGNGTSRFIVLGPASTLTPLATDPGSTTSNVKFNWTKSIPAVGSPAVKYKVLFVLRTTDADGKEITPDFTNPLFSVASDNGGTDSLLTFTYKAINDSLNARGQTNLSQASELKWTVTATSGTWVQRADYTNSFVILREVRMYMPGSYTTPAWDPPTAPELVRDLRAGGGVNTIYYTYVYLTAGTEFKVTQGRAWDVNYGPSTSTTGTSGTLQQNPADNFKISTTGIYRFSVDRVNMTYDLRLGRMGFVGAGIAGVGWDPPTTFNTPSAQLQYLQRDQFIGITNFLTDEWKLIDNNSFNGGAISIADTRTYGSKGDGSGSGSPLAVNGGDNLPAVAAAGRYRVIWDGTDVNNVKYILTPGNLYVIGEATVGGWDNLATQNDAQRPPFTYLGNGKWTVTTNLTAGQFKFIVKKGSWDFNYGIKAGKLSINGDNLSVPANGTYTITIDEYNQTYSVL